MSMKRRAFFSAFTVGTVATVAGGAKQAQAATLDPEVRDLKWAKEMLRMGFRVRLESWTTPVEDRPSEHTENDACVSMRMGQASGVASLDELIVTVEMLDGPWECVPEADMPKPPAPPRKPVYGQEDQYIFLTNDFAESSDITLSGGHGGNIRIAGGKNPKR